MEISEHIVKRLGTRAGRRTERSNIQITREIFERMSLMPYISSIPVVHVAGTKGKGTTSALTAELLHKSCNFKSVALFQSPHLVDIRERVLINNQFIEEKQFLSLFKQFEEEYDQKCDSIFESKDQNTPERDRALPSPYPNSGQGVFKDRTHFFRSMFAFSVYVMKSLSVEAAVIEVGIGGRLDPTNIIPPPTCCIVTCLGMDHCDILGNTIEEIASEKAGIYKKGSVCFSAPQNDYPETRKVLEKFCREEANNNNINNINGDDNKSNNNSVSGLIYPNAMTDFATTITGENDVKNNTTSKNNTTQEVFSKLAREKGDHVVENAALALAASRVVGKKWGKILQENNNNNNNNSSGSSSSIWGQYVPLSPTESEILSKFKLDGRSQKIFWKKSNDNNNSGVESTFLIDGAHTVESVRRAIRWALSTTTSSSSLTVIFGTSRPPGPQLEEIVKAATLVDSVDEKTGNIDNNNPKKSIDKFIFINIPELLAGRTSAEKCVEYVSSSSSSSSFSLEEQCCCCSDALKKIPYETAENVEAALDKNVVNIERNKDESNDVDAKSGKEKDDKQHCYLVVGSMYSAGGALSWLRANGECRE